MSSRGSCPDVFEPGAFECLGCPEWLTCGWGYVESLSASKNEGNQN